MKKHHSKQKKIHRVKTMHAASRKKKSKEHHHRSLASRFKHWFSRKKHNEPTHETKKIHPIAKTPSKNKEKHADKKKKHAISIKEKFSGIFRKKQQKALEKPKPHEHTKITLPPKPQVKAEKKGKDREEANATKVSLKEKFSTLFKKKEKAAQAEHKPSKEINPAVTKEDQEQPEETKTEEERTQVETQEKPSIALAPGKKALEPKAAEKKPEKQEQKKTIKKEAKPILSFKERLAWLFKKKHVEKWQKDKTEKKPILHARKHQLRFYLERAGILVSPHKISRRIFDCTVILNLLFSSYLIYYYSVYTGYSTFDLILVFLLLWTVVLAAIMTIIWMLLYLYLDLRIFKRKVEIEEVLPDYLQLTASNIKAGMTIDRALWYAVRPRFGVLAYEIEVVAKETMKGIDLKVALEHFASKYDSAILKRSMSLLIEGIESGGQIGTLLNKISINIQENKIMKREMAANVTTYVIFISFATIAAAPALFALSGVLIKVISSLGGSLGEATAATSGMGLSITFSGSGIEYGDFKIFAIVSLIISSFFSSMIIATIMKGSVKHGFKYIPVFIATTITIFLIADFILGKLVNLVI